MQKKVKQFMEKWQMLCAEDVVIVGVSGGADSVCLLVLLQELQKEMGFGLRVVHVNHGIRGGEARRDEQYVLQLCRERKIPCEVVRVDVPALAKEQKISEEEAGRNARRKALEENRKRNHGTKIALAHHQEDNAETFFLHLARGSKLKGLGGIYPVNGVYIRPLLCVGKKEIEAYLGKRKISYCMDQTNLEDTYMRNRIRNHVLPFFREQVNEKTIEHMNVTMEYLREVQGYLEERQKEAYDKMIEGREREKVLIREDGFWKTPHLIRNMVLRETLVQSAGQEKDLEECHVVELADLMMKQAGKRIHLPYNMEAIRVYEGILIGKRQENEEKPEAIALHLVDCGEWEFGGIRFSYRMLEGTGELSQVPKKPFTKWFDYDIINKECEAYHCTLEMRTRCSGDRIVIDDKGNSKKLKSFFVDQKIPLEKREKIPILSMEHQVLWVVGYRQSKKYQVTEKTKMILEIIADGGI